MKFDFEVSRVDCNTTRIAENAVSPLSRFCHKQILSLKTRHKVYASAVDTDTKNIIHILKTKKKPKI